MKQLAIIYALIICYFSPKDKLLKINHDLNGWIWPFKHFGKYYNSLIYWDSNNLVRVTRFTLTIPISKYIKTQLSDWEILRYHNSDMNDVQFNDWWRLCYGTKTDTQYDEYYTKYPIK